MGNRLHITMIANLSSDTPSDLLEDLKVVSSSPDNSRLGFLYNNFNYCDGNQTVKVSAYRDVDRDLYSKTYDETHWLEIHTCFKNYNNEFEHFWREIQPYIIPHNGLDKPIGHFWDDTRMGLIMVDGLHSM